MSGMVSADEQSKVPRVFILITVGMPDFASVFFGKYPPLALMVIICFPFSMRTLSEARVCAVFELCFFSFRIEGEFSAFRKKRNHAIRTTRIATAKSVILKMFFFIGVACECFRILPFVLTLCIIIPAKAGMTDEVFQLAFQ